MYAIKVTDLTKQYDKYNAVNHIHMNVPKGVVYGFIGPNGAGKTTTIGMIMGHKKATTGTIEILDQKIDFYDSKYKKHIGFVSDVPEFYNYMNAREFLNFCGDIFYLSSSKKKEKINEVLEIVGLKDTRKSIGTYSRGMRQRLGIAQALIHDPEIIIMDEPTSALDPIGRKDVMDIILKLKGEKTIFYSTHILTDVERVCDVVGIINEGNVLVEDTMLNIKKKYLTTKIIIETNQSFDVMKQVFKDEKWFKDMYLQNTDSCLSIDDEELAMTRIPQIVAENGWQLRKFIKEEQTLEDIFLKVVGKV